MPYLEDALIEEPDDTFRPLGSDLQEAIGDQQPGGGETFALEQSEATVVYQIPFNKKRSFLRWVLGFSCVERSNYAHIHRENPQHHPVFPDLYATACAFSAFPPKIEEDGLLYLPSKWPSFRGIKRYASYEVAYATVKFAAPPWQYRPDARITTAAQEVERNCYVDVSSTVEMLSAEGELGQMKWSAPTVAGGPTFGTAVTAPFGTLVSKANLLLTWSYVPELWLSVEGGTSFYPSNLLACVGTMNDDTFLGKPPGTLLMQPPVLKRFRWPVTTFDAIGAFYGYNVTIPFQYFDPSERGAPNFPSALNPDRGYKLLPFSRSLKWYPATRANGVTHLLNESTFSDIFERAV